MTTPNDSRPFDGFDLSSPDHYDVADTILPMVERAAAACESLSLAARDVERRDRELEQAIPRVEAMIDHARLQLSLAHPAPSPHAQPLSRDDVQHMINWAIAGVEARVDQKVDRLADDLSTLAQDLAAKVAGVANMLASKAESTGDTRSEIERAMAPILLSFESQMLELIDAFRARAEQAAQSIEGTAEDRASRLEQLCTRAERLLAVGESGVMDVIDELSTTIRPFKGALIEGKNGVEIHGPLADVLTHMREELRHELAAGKPAKPADRHAPKPSEKEHVEKAHPDKPHPEKAGPVVKTTTKKSAKPVRRSKAA
ncbi:MAG: hypothetical protein JNL50_05050 [Phycisphaerae bacterium]|nr:hypothetical protein [Phycisphaerae bacterium]